MDIRASQSLRSCITASCLHLRNPLGTESGESVDFASTRDVEYDTFSGEIRRPLHRVCLGPDAPRMADGASSSRSGCPNARRLVPEKFRRPASFVAEFQQRGKSLLSDHLLGACARRGRVVRPSQHLRSLDVQRLQQVFLPEPLSISCHAHGAQPMFAPQT